MSLLALQKKKSEAPPSPKITDGRKSRIKSKEKYQMLSKSLWNHKKAEIGDFFSLRTTQI
jgi:hypothetical protein